MSIFLPILLWWLIAQLFGWAALPIAFRIFRWLPDRGYAFSKALGLLLVSYLYWMGTMTGVLGNNLGGIWFALLVVVGISGWLFLRRPGASRDELLRFLRDNRSMIIAVEVLFLAAFAGWAVFRAFATQKIMEAGGEKFMEIAFLNSILRSPHLPPLDPWMSGFSISYYYFGYIMMAAVTRLSGVAAGVGFDLYDALLFALTAVGAFGVVYNLIPAAKKRSSTDPGDGSGRKLNAPITYGLWGALFTVGLGNLEGVLESLQAWGKLSASLVAWLGVKQLAETPINGTPVPANYWWWWHASRIIWDRDLAGNALGNENITEFPFFSFLLGDNHPHVLNLPFVLLAIALALNLLRAVLERAPQPATADTTPSIKPWWNAVAAVFENDWFQFLAYALCLGALGFVNTWDFPIYIGLTVLAFGVGKYAHEKKLTRALILPCLALGVELLAAGVLFFALFYVGFSSQAGGLLPYIFPPTRSISYLIMFGPFLVILITFLLINLVRQIRQNGTDVFWKTLIGYLGFVIITLVVFVLLVLIIPTIGAVRQLIQGAMENPVLTEALGGQSIEGAVSAIIQNRLRDPWLYLLLAGLLTLIVSITFWLVHPFGEEAGEEKTAKISPSILFVCMLVFLGVGLTFIVEFVYLRDVFGARMNTVFKFYYQAWVTMACASAYGLWWIMNRGGRIIGTVGKAIFASVFAVMLAAGLVYPLMAMMSRTNGFSSQPFGPNLDGASVFARDNPDDWAAIEWLRANANAQGPESTYGTPVILEAPGGSYNYEGRISAFSGFPAVLGWAAHELQWRGNYDEQGLREPDIATIYTTHRASEALELLRKWQVNYVIVGQTEMNYISRLCTAQGGQPAQKRCSPSTAIGKFAGFLNPVFSQGQMTIYLVP